MAQDDFKKKAAEAAIEHIKNLSVLGIGTGSTVNYFIDLLADYKSDIDATVSSSEASTVKLKQLGIPVMELNNVGSIETYVDGADEINHQLQMIKGGGGALTREKIVAAASKKFVCIADDTKVVNILGSFPLPIEVIPMARSFVAREVIKLGGQPQLRENFITDNGNQIVDIHNLGILEPLAMETRLNNIPGIVTVGLFASRKADLALIGSASGVTVMQYSHSPPLR